MSHQIVGLHHANVRLPSSSEQATKQFYGKLLGLTPDPNFTSAATVVHWCVGDTGSEVHTKWGEEPTRLKSGEVLPNHFALLVEDLEATKSYLTQNGVPFEEADLPGARHEIFIKDPEGNIVELQQVGAHH